MEWADLLQSGELVDCTIRVRTSSLNYKDFKCHRLVLSVASEVFRKAFYGQFKEATMGLDDPILLDNVEPQVFDIILRYLYGAKVAQEDFENVTFGVEVYRLCHEMQIKFLTTELDKIFKNTNKASGVFAIFDLYHRLDVQQGLIFCKQVLEVETAEALSSEHWLSISSDSVEEFLQMDCLDVKDVDLIRALVRWGKFQVQIDGDDPNDAQKLRLKIMPGLKHIRFASLTKNQITKLLMVELIAVLSSEEKSLIRSKDWTQLLPIGSVKITPRKKAHVVCHFHDLFDYDDFDVWFKSDVQIKRQIDLQINRKAVLIGLKLGKLPEFVAWKEVKFQLKDEKKRIISNGNLKKEISHDGEDFFRFTPKCTLNPYTKYILSFVYVGPDEDFRYQNFALESNTSVTTGWLTVTIDSDISLIDIESMSMLFAKA